MVRLSVCLLVTTVSPTKTAELIEVPFGCGLGVGLGTLNSLLPVLIDLVNKDDQRGDP